MDFYLALYQIRGRLDELTAMKNIGSDANSRVAREATLSVGEINGRF